ncbi:MAG: tetratricopeptide repeat protein, partial [Desulfonatronovibrionaceae bacterium]
GFRLYSLSTEHPGLNLPANYSIIPGFQFRERTPGVCLGLIAGRILAEEAEPLLALSRLEQLAQIYPQGFFIPFHQGLVYQRMGMYGQALEMFTRALDIQPHDQSRGLCAFYCAYSLTLEQKWTQALPFLNQAVTLDPGVKEYFNLRGVAFYKQNDYEAAMNDFHQALSLDKGSAVDLANLGLCQLSLGRKEEAAATLAMAVKLDPGLDFAQEKLKEMAL